MKVIAKGHVDRVLYSGSDQAEVFIIGSRRYLDLTWAEADKALSAKRSAPPREIEILEDVCTTTRAVRIVPSLVIRARGKVRSVALGDGDVSALAVIHVGGPRYYSVRGDDDAARAAAFAMAADAEVEIVSIDGGPDTVRVP